MGAISSLTESVGVLRRNPVLFVAAFLAALLGSLGTVGQLGGLAATIGLTLLTYLVLPFIIGGMLGMAEEAVGDRTHLGTFVDEGISNYLSLVGAFLLLFVVFVALSIVFAILTMVIAVVGTFALASGSGAGGMAGLGLVAVFGLFALLVVAVVAFFLQFFDVAVVVSDEGAVGSLKRSARVARENALAAFGFLVIYTLITLLAAVPGIWLSVTSMSSPTAVAGPMAVSQAMAGPTLAELVPVVVATVVISTFTSALLYTYKVSFYTSASRAVAAN